LPGAGTFSVELTSIAPNAAVQSQQAVSVQGSIGEVADYQVSLDTSRALSQLKVNPRTITLSSALAPARVGVVCRQAITGGGGTAPYQFSITGGRLPPGLTLNPSTGTLSVIPRTPGTFSFVLKATDSSMGTGPFSTTRSFTLTVRQGDAARLVLPTQPSIGLVNVFLPPLQVLVLDQSGNRLSGVVVRLALWPITTVGPAGCSAGSVVQATTVNGVATFSRVAIATRGRYKLLIGVGVADVLSNPFDGVQPGRES
jgi:hypothetical protein